MEKILVAGLPHSGAGSVWAASGEKPRPMAIMHDATTTVTVLRSPGNRSWDNS
jgi:hypothetical protein